MSSPSPSPLERQQIAVADPAKQTYWHRVRFHLVANDAAQRGATTLLDVGAGSGLLGEWLQRWGQPLHLRYRFTELSPVLDAQLTERFGSDARHGPQEPIDELTAVAMLDVLEHIEDDGAALRELHRKMAPGARLEITVPALQWAFSSWDTELGHHRRYGKRSLRKVVTAAGFTVERCDYLFPELLPLLLVRKLRRAPRADVDFPHLPAPVAAAGYGVARATTALRRIWPAGTSVVLTASRPR